MDDIGQMYYIGFMIWDTIVLRCQIEDPVLFGSEDINIASFYLWDDYAERSIYGRMQPCCRFRDEVW